jgi:hypothetical protein
VGGDTSDGREETLDGHGGRGRVEKEVEEAARHEVWVGSQVGPMRVKDGR